MRDDGGTFDARNSSSFRAISGRVNSRDARSLAQRAANQRRQQELARELVACVDRMRAHGATRQRASAQLAELIALTHVERDGHDVSRRTSRSSQWNRRSMTRTRLNRRGRSCFMRVDISSSRLTSVRARRASGVMIRIVSSPASVPTTSGSSAPSSAAHSDCAWPRPVAAARAAGRDRCAAAATRARAGTSPSRLAVRLDAAPAPDRRRRRRPSRDRAHGCRATASPASRRSRRPRIMPPQLLLAADRLLPNDVEDGGLASRFHGNVSDVTSE